MLLPLLLLLVTVRSINGIESSASPLSVLSNCSYAFPLDDHSEKRFIDPPSVFDFNPLKNATLNVINAGFGTTGTRFLFQEQIAVHRSGCHFQDCHPPAATLENRLLRHFDLLLECVPHAAGTYDHSRSKTNRKRHLHHQKQIKFDESKCDTAWWMGTLRQLLIRTASSGLQVLADTPVPFLFAELRRLVPDLLVQHSLRNPHEWLMRRIVEHYKHSSGDLMCDVEQMQHTDTADSRMNPFNILPCIAGTHRIQDRLTTTVLYIGMDSNAALRYIHGEEKMPEVVSDRIREVGQFFTAFNSYVQQHTPPGRYQAVCVWDNHAGR